MIQSAGDCIIFMNDIYQASIELSDGVNESGYVNTNLLGGALKVRLERQNVPSAAIIDMNILY